MRRGRAEGEGQIKSADLHEDVLVLERDRAEEVHLCGVLFREALVWRVLDLSQESREGVFWRRDGLLDVESASGGNVSDTGSYLAILDQLHEHELLERLELDRSGNLGRRGDTDLEELLRL